MSKNGFIKVGKMNGQDIYEKNGKLSKEVDHRRLVQLTPGEREQFENQTLRISLDN